MAKNLANLRSMRELEPGLRAVYDLACSVQGAHGTRSLLSRLCRSVAETFGFERTAISGYQPELKEVHLLAAHGVEVADVRQLSSALADWPYLGRALAERDLVLIENVQEDAAMPDHVVADYGVRSVLALPLFNEERCLGFLSADRGGEPLELDDEAAALLCTMGALATAFLEQVLVQEELRRADVLKTNFIALASHELRTSAAVIYGISSTLHHRGDQLAGEQLTELRSALHLQSERMRQLVEQLLDLSRLEARAIRIQPERMPVRQRLEYLVLTLLPERIADVEIEVAPDLEATADPDAFDRIVSNLLTNAFRYGSPPIIVSAAQRDRHFRLAVEDRGVGVSPEFVPQLFERFTRSRRSREESGASGAGLGLSIAQQYAQAHGGDLLYRAAEPHGARFELVLPGRSG